MENNKIIDSTKSFATLIKLGKLEHLEDLRKGYLFMNTIGYFKDLKPDGQRADLFEGAIGCYQAKDTELVFKNEKTGETFKLTDLNSFYLHGQGLLACHIFCTYAIHPGEYHDRPIDSEEVKQAYQDYLKLTSDKEAFGGHLLYFTDVNEFFRRLDAALMKEGLAGRRGPTVFFDENSYHGSFPKDRFGFLKPLSYQHQNEYRILVQGIKTNPYKLFVGDLSDICKITTVEQFNASLTIEMPEE